MTVSSGRRPRSDSQNAKPAEIALNWAAISAAAGALFAWAACCVLPMSLALAGLSLGGLSWFAVQRTWITLAALALLSGGWVVTWRRARMCRSGGACTAPSQLGIGLLSIASFLVLLALAWQPLVEPWALALIRSVR